jgi:hypothetical protein
MIFEGFKFSYLKQIEKKVLKDLGMIFGFVATFGVSITAFYPVVQNLIKNMKLEYPISMYDIILMTICALSVCFKENRDKIDIAISLIKEKGIVEVYNKIFKSLQSMMEFFTKVAEAFGKSINFIADIFTYTALLIPFISIILDFINTHEVNAENLPGYLLSTGVGIGVNISKNLFNEIIIRLRNKFGKK